MNALATSLDARRDTLPNLRGQRVLVLGATAGVGRHLVRAALRAGASVTAFGRSATRAHFDEDTGVRGGFLTVQQGDATNVDELRKLVPSHDAVLMAIGAPRTSKALVRTRSMEALVEALRADPGRVARVVCLSGFGAGETHPYLPPFLRYAVFPLLLRRVYADHAGQEAAFARCPVPATLVRPTSLTDGEGDGSFIEHPTLQGAKTYRIDRVDVANVMLRALTQKDAVGRAISISH